MIKIYLLDSYKNEVLSCKSISVPKNDNYLQISDSLQREFNISEIPQLYALREGTVVGSRFRISEESMLKSALSNGLVLCSSRQRLTPSNSCVSIYSGVCNNEHNSPNTRQITFPEELMVFPSTIVDCSNLYGQFKDWLKNVNTLPFRTCCMVNGLVKSGKTMGCKYLFPAVAAEIYPDSVCGYIDLIYAGMGLGSEITSAMGALRFGISKYLAEALGIKVEFSGNDLLDVKQDILSFIGMAKKFHLLNFMIIDETQRIFQTKLNTEMELIFKAIVTDTNRQGNLRIIFTGSTLVRAWHGILNCPPNGTPPFQDIQLINIEPNASPEAMELARNLMISNYQADPDLMKIEMISNPATMSYFVSEWKNISGLDKRKRIENTEDVVKKKFQNEFLAEVYPLLKIMPKKDLRIWYTLIEGTGTNPSSSLEVFAAILSPFITESEKDGKPHWKFSTSYFAYFLGLYIEDDGTLRDSPYDKYNITDYYKHMLLHPFSFLGEHVWPYEQKKKQIMDAIELVMKAHFCKLEMRIDVDSFETHPLVQPLINHKKNSVRKIWWEKNKATFNGYFYCFTLNLIRNFTSHTLDDLESVKSDLERISIPEIRALWAAIRGSEDIQQLLSTLKMYPPYI